MVGGVEWSHLVVRQNVERVWSLLERRKAALHSSDNKSMDLNCAACEMFAEASKVEVGPLWEMRWRNYCHSSDQAAAIGSRMVVIWLDDSQKMHETHLKEVPIIVWRYVKVLISDSSEGKRRINYWISWNYIKKFASSFDELVERTAWVLNQNSTNRDHQITETYSSSLEAK